ncbi:MAG: tRNA epoxyqueuosine(34) reductase QueG [Planctomycetaceae bacterium]
MTPDPVPPPPANGSLSPAHVSGELRRLARDAGFDLVGLTPARRPPGFEHLVDWLAHGYHGELEYIPRRLPAYGELDHVLPGARTVLALAVNYLSAPAAPPDPTPPASWPASPESDSAPLPNSPLLNAPLLSPPAVAGRVARYAWGSGDYHDLLRARLHRLITRIRTLLPHVRARGVVDTAPVLERDFAQQAGLGWFGKNTLLINRPLGSWTFLAAVLLDVEVEYDAPFTSDHCGTCTRCLDICPTDAFPAPHVLDARRCISYLTIELRGNIPQELRAGVGDWLFGCDLCQEVCPWNRRAPLSSDPAWSARHPDGLVDVLEWLALTDEQLAARLVGTPLERPGVAGVRRNAAIVAGNSHDARCIPLLYAQRGQGDVAVRRAAAWGLGQVGTADTFSLLTAWLGEEADPEVRDELRQAETALRERLAESAPAVQ